MSIKLVRHRQSPYWYVRGSIDGHKVIESTKTTDRAQAEQYLEMRQAQIYRDKVIRIGQIETIPEDMIRELAAVCDRANNRSQKRKRSERLERTFVHTLYLKQCGRCAVSGIPFSIDPDKGDHKPFAPSLDRLDNALGYSPSNVRLVCRIANYAMNIWGDMALLELSKGVVAVWQQACAEQFTRQLSTNSPVSPLTKVA